MSASAIFDESFYLTNNADVVVAISQGFFGSALQHYNLFGGKELRAPNATFNPNYYAINNADVLNAVAAGIFPNVFAHYQEFGEKENRAPSTDYASFDATAYLAANADVAAAVTAGTTLSLLVKQRAEKVQVWQQLLLTEATLLSLQAWIRLQVLPITTRSRQITHRLQMLHRRPILWMVVQVQTRCRYSQMVRPLRCLH